ncbi:hypothetical protein [Halalkalicoccus ordinarius]|uniref:hypothetical protein n=1 Tax=Halalkalicoccus ordinarius TaxID=3116651 RepID=UPI00300F5268
MDQMEFECKYPTLSALLPDDLINRCDDDHPLKICIDRDREPALEMWSKLVEQSPAEKLVKTYDNNLYSRGKFNAFVTELWCYQALIQWLCEDPQVLDLPDKQGMPDFACEDFDVDATLLQEADEEYRIRRKLEDVMDNLPYIGRLSLKSEFDIQATTHERWSENEEAVDDFINLIEQDLNPDDPETIETNALRVEFEEKEQGSFAWIGTWDRRRGIKPDDEGKIAERLRTKADQPRNGRPLVVFINCEHTSISSADEVRDILIGEPYGFAIRENVDLSPRVQSISNEWEDYLIEISAIPNPNDKREIAFIEKSEDSSTGKYRSFPAIRPGDEGVFQEDDLDQIAGVMLRMKNSNVCYIPNTYTNTVDARSIYENLGWKLETFKLTSEDL